MKIRCLSKSSSLKVLHYFVEVMFPFCLLLPRPESSKALSARCSAKRAAEAMQARTVEAVDVDGPNPAVQVRWWTNI